MSRTKKYDDYKPMSEKGKFAFLILSLWFICVPILFVITNRNLYKNAIDNTFLWIHWGTFIAVYVSWLFIWKKKGNIKMLSLLSASGALLFLVIFLWIKPKYAYYDVMIEIQKTHPEMAVQAFITDDDLKSDNSKTHYYLTQASKPYNYFLKYNYVIYGRNMRTTDINEYFGSPITGHEILNPK